MITNRLATFWMLTSLLLALQVEAWAADSPLEMIRSTINQVTNILEHRAYQGEQHRQDRVEKVWQVVAPHFDMQELAQRALGARWRERTEGERQEFVQLFTALIEKAYSATLTRYTSDVQFLFDEERIEDRSAEVDTRLVNSSLDKTIPIRYQLHQVGGQWLIYDVVIENVSLVRNYRTQFNRIMSQSSYENLVQEIKKKIEEPSTVTSSAKTPEGMGRRGEPPF